MKRLLSIIICMSMLMVTLTACGATTDDVKKIDKGNTTTATTTNSSSNETTTDKTGSDVQAEAGAKLNGYVFAANGFEFTVDMDMKDVLAGLGEADSYYEAASCAFQGLDKIYTYNHFEVDTYPDGDKDIVSCILLRDDMVKTPEGVAIGDKRSVMEEKYGTDYDNQGGACVYSKDGMKLKFIISNDVISSIEYDSAAMDMAN